MTTIRQHMQASHQAAAEQHAGLAACCSKLEECFSGMGKAAGEDGPMYHTVASHFGATAKIHSDARDAHAGFASECEKAEEDRLGKTIVPDNFRGVIPSDVPGFGIRAIPRPGGPEIPATFDKSTVPPQFRHLISSGDEL